MTNLLLLDPRNIYTDELREYVIWEEENNIKYQDLTENFINSALQFIKVFSSFSFFFI